MNELEVVKMILEEKRKWIEQLRGHFLDSFDSFRGKVDSSYAAYAEVLDIITKVEEQFKESRDSDTEALKNLLGKAIPFEELIEDADDGIIDDCFLDHDEPNDMRS